MSERFSEGIGSIVFTDIEGSTELLRALGTRFDALLARHHALIRAAMSSCGGVEVGTEGDAFFVLFDRPADAIAACVTAQRQLAAEPWPDDRVLRVRMGIHVGEVRPGGDNFIGMGVHQAARVTPAAHGGQIIVSSAVADAVGPALPEDLGLLDLGAFHLRDFDGGQHLFQVLHPDLERTFPPPRVASAVVHNMPAQRTAFVGRSFELGEIAKLVGTAALVTVVGPGGVGKTRLTSQVGLGVAGDFDGGVWFVALHAATDPHGLESAVIDALGLRDEPGRTSFETICEKARAAKTLIILDNCEHLVDACASFVDELVKATDKVTVLVTSREPLQIVAEHVFRLSPLAVPVTDDVNLDQIPAFPSMELFVVRARQIERDFELNATTAPLIARICRTLDGVPLAVELAAARVGDLGIEALESSIDDALLDLSRRGGVDRQRSLRATIEWSVRLLNDEKRQVFRRLAPFVGGFTAESAAEVTGGGEGTARVLRDMVACSLVEFEPDRDPPRFRLLEPIRRYLHDELDAAGERIAVDEAFLRWAFDLVNSTDGADRGRFRARTDAEVTNISAAFDLAMGRGDVVVASDLCLSYALYAEVRGLWREAVSRLARVLELDLALAPSSEANLRIMRADIVKRLGLTAAAEEDLARALDLMREINDERGVAGCLMSYAQVVKQAGRFDDARKLYEEAYEATRAVGLLARAATCLADLGTIAQLDDLSASRRYLEDSYEIRVQTNDDVGRGSCFLLLGNGAIVAGDLDEAESFFTQAQDVMAPVGYRAGIAAAIKGLGIVAQSRGNLSAARDFYVRALDEFVSMGEPMQTAQCHAHLATVELAEGKMERAVEMLAESLPALAGPFPHLVALYLDPLAVIYADRDPPRAVRMAGALAALLSAPLFVNPRKRLAILRAIDALQTKLGSDRFAVEFASGERYSWDELIKEATR